MKVQLWIRILRDLDPSRLELFVTEQRVGETFEETELSI